MDNVLKEEAKYLKGMLATVLMSDAARPHFPMHEIRRLYECMEKLIEEAARVKGLEPPATVPASVRVPENLIGWYRSGDIDGECIWLYANGRLWWNCDGAGVWIDKSNSFDLPPTFDPTEQCTKEEAAAAYADLCKQRPEAKQLPEIGGGE